MKLSPEELLDKAKQARALSYSPYSHFAVGAALECADGSVFCGANIENASFPLGMCAERNAIANMITNGESQIDKVVAVMPDGRVGSPCGACREYMMQLDKDSGEIEILLDLDNQKTVKLKDLIPDWWGTHKFTE